MGARETLSLIIARSNSSPQNVGEAQQALDSIEGLAARALRELGPLVNVKKLTITLLVLGGIAGIVALGLIPGWTQSTYEWVWLNTTNRPWTEVMRDNWWYMPLPAAAIMAFLARWIPLRYWGRVVVMFSTFGIAFLAGHVFWGQ